MYIDTVSKLMVLPVKTIDTSNSINQPEQPRVEIETSKNLVLECFLVGLATKIATRIATNNQDFYLSPSGESPGLKLFPGACSSLCTAASGRQLSSVIIVRKQRYGKHKYNFAVCFYLYSP